jgi:hypothetical protein
MKNMDSLRKAQNLLKPAYHVSKWLEISNLFLGPTADAAALNRTIFEENDTRRLDSANR